MKLFKTFAAVLAVAAMVSCTGTKQQSENVMKRTEPANIMVVVDLQKDFIDGNLPATDGTRVVEPIKNVLKNFDNVYFTLDWHPWNHCSFKANGGIWPQHCVRYTVGAALPDGILDSLNIDNVRFLPKGMAQDKEEYGQFENTVASDQDLFIKGDKVVVCGIAAEYCVLETLKNLVRLSQEIGFELSVYLEGVASIESNEPLVTYMNENNIKIYK
jgi:nicotinamidase-related amidase